MKKLLFVSFISCLFGTSSCPQDISKPAKNFDFFADLIFWSAQEAGADCWAEVITSSGSSSSNDLLSVQFGWDLGFRVGFGYETERDFWDTQTYYTWFYTRGKDSVSSSPGAIHSTYLGNFYVDNPYGLGLSGPSYQQANIDWTIRFNIFDIELGRKISVSPALVLRPFLGIKGGWIDQSIDSTWENPNLSGAEFFQTGTENLKNNFWGIGPQAGLNTDWYLYSGKTQFFHLLGGFSGAMMWGHWSFSDLFQNDLPQQVSVSLPDVNSGASMVRGWIGLSWEMDFHPRRFSVQLSYESQFWLDQLQFYSFTAGRLVNELTLQGGTLEFCLDF